VLVKLTDSDGCHGWGEGRPVPQWSYETLESVTTTLRGYLAPAVLGMPVTDRLDLPRRLHAAIGRGPSPGMPIAKAAIDMALHDLLARKAGLTLRESLGGSRERREMALSWTITAHTVEELRADWDEGRAGGFRHFNFKAALTPATDRGIADRLCDWRPDGGFVWADANQGYRLHAARLAAADFRAAGVDVLEQPLAADQFEQMRALRASTDLPLAVDEASVGAADFLRYAAAGLVDYLVVKVTRSGGLGPSQTQLAVAAAAGLPLLLSGLTDGLLTKLAASQLCLAHGFAGPAALNGSQFIDESLLYPDKAAVEADGRLTLPDRPGIGVEPDPAGLAALAAD
jgi:muconate cycloisomerase